MKKIEKILNSSNKKKLLKYKGTKQFIKKANADFAIFGLNYKVKTMQDYFRIEALYRSLEQKRAIEQGYEENRQQMFDIWDVIDYKERNKFAEQYLSKLRGDLKSFEENGKIIIITFFNEIINALYDHEPAVFELPQFYKLFDKFKDSMVDDTQYGVKSYRSGFLYEETVCLDDDYCAVYHSELKKIYIIFNDLTIKVLPLNKKLTEFVVEEELIKSYAIGDKQMFINCVKVSKLFSDKVINKICKFGVSTDE